MSDLSRLSEMFWFKEKLTGEWNNAYHNNRVRSTIDQISKGISEGL